MRSCARHEKTRDEARMLVHAGNALGAIAVAARGQCAGKEFACNQRELHLRNEEPGDKTPLEWLLDKPMAGDGAFFSRPDAVTAVGAVGDRVRTNRHRVRPYQCHGCELKQTHALIAVDSRRRKPISERG
jgi:hypothetical protein